MSTPDISDLEAIVDVGVECGAKAKVKKPKGCKKCKCPMGMRCFAPGTLVHTKEGLKAIEDIQPGDLVKSMNVETGEIDYKPVTNVHVNEFDPVGEVSLLDEKDGSETFLSVTATHPFYSEDRGWIHASQLEIGEKLREDDGGTLTVSSVVFDPDAPIEKTYNIEVAEWQNYFVGEDGVLVHNGGPFNPDQSALLSLVKDVMRRRGSLSEKEWKIIKQWAQEFGLPCRGPEVHPNRPHGKFPHGHLGALNHIPIK